MSWSYEESLNQQIAQKTEQINELMRRVHDLEELLSEANKKSSKKDAQIEELQELSVTDQLTGVMNRRGGEAAYRKLAGQIKRHNSSLPQGSDEEITGKKFICVVMMDADHFKSINDNFGHDNGDTVLRALATSVNNAMREEETFARYGGEEFVAILAVEDAREGYLAARRLHEAVAGAQPIELKGYPAQKVTMSFGVAVFDPADIPDFECGVGEADRALYQAKGAGRDCVCYTPDPHVPKSKEVESLIASQLALRARDKSNAPASAKQDPGSTERRMYRKFPNLRPLTRASRGRPNFPRPRF